MLRKLNSFIKGLLLATRIGLLFAPIKRFLKFFSNLAEMTLWINKYHKKAGYTDFYKPIKNYQDRTKLHSYVCDQFDLRKDPIQYYEFGVASGSSFRWWLKENTNPESKFWGFDTFEGLPEDWHFYKKGDMGFNIPDINDDRATFIKGLFQDTFFEFLKKATPIQGVKKVLHMDADLYSSTLFILTSIAPYLADGDIILFDEFNVPNHEFAAWHDFERSYYAQYEIIGGVNNYYQVALKFKGFKVAL